MNEEKFELVQLKSGIMSLRSKTNNETFHPVTGPEIEAQILHVDQQRLIERALTHKKLIIWDVGLGAGANALAVIKALSTSEEFKKSGGEVELYSFDRTIGPLEFAMQNAAQLKYLVGYENILERLIAESSVQVTPKIVWNFCHGDFSKFILDAPKTMAALPLHGIIPAPHGIIYDPYSAVSNPDMWTLEHFSRLFLTLDSARPCLLTNYTRSTAVRVSLLLSGFYVGVGRAVGEKAETTIASNKREMIEAPLDQKWLERVRISRNGSPLREAQRVPGQRTLPSYQTVSMGHSAIDSDDYERLRAHDQFCF